MGRKGGGLRGWGLGSICGSVAVMMLTGGALGVDTNAALR